MGDDVKRLPINILNDNYFISLKIGLLLGMPVAAFVVHDPNTFTICNTTHPIPRSSPAFLDWQEGIHQQLLIYLLAQAIAASILLPITFCKSSIIAHFKYILLLCVGVPSAPPIPPSISEAEKKEYKKLSAFRSLLELYKNIPFVLLSIVFSKLHFLPNFYNATIFQQFLLLFLALLQHRLKKYLLILATVNINRQLDMQELLLQLYPLFLFCLEVCGWLTAKHTSEKLTIFQSLL